MALMSEAIQFSNNIHYDDTIGKCWPTEDVRVISCDPFRLIILVLHLPEVKSPQPGVDWFVFLQSVWTAAKKTETVLWSAYQLSTEV